MKYVFAALLACALPTSVCAQVPGTDLYRIRMRDGMLAQLSAPENLTARAGYDNQPGFLPDSQSLRYTSIDSVGQADIYFLDLTTGRSLSLTHNLTSEYSPTSIPASDRFSVVRVEADSTQRLWSFAADGSDPQLLLPDVPGVGYHVWGEASELLLFVLGEPHELHRARLGEVGSERVAVEIGRCLQKIPGGDAWSFVQRNANGGWAISRLDRVSGVITRIADTPAAEVEDYCWTPGGKLWSSDGTSIVEWQPGVPGTWGQIRNLAQDGISGITRLAVSPVGDALIFVADDPAN
jgi:hypothetical protein